MKLSYDDVKKYIAHINLKKVGSFGQKKIIDTNLKLISLKKG
jgi:hypothetical protein